MKKSALLLMALAGTMLCSCTKEGNGKGDSEVESGNNDRENENKTVVIKNPISKESAPDPYVKYIDGYYYGLFTEADKITLFRSKSIENIVQDEKKIVFTIGNEVQGHVWAPELYYFPSTGKWYIYACGSKNGWEFGTIRMFCLESVSSDPFGEYIFKGFTDTNTLAIDQTIFYDEKSETLYTAFSEFTHKGQVITLAVMDNPWTISDKRIEVSYPKYEWETRGATEGKDERVNEGPIFLYHSGKLFLFYSGSGCWSEYYCLGMLEYTGADFTEENVMNIDNWVKYTEPAFSSANKVYGVGHCSFFASPDETETWIAYHGMHVPDAGESGRYMYVQKISFDKNGIPVLGEPLSRNTEMAIPSENMR